MSHVQNQGLRTALGLLLILAVGLLFGGCRKYPNCRKDAHCERFEEREVRDTPYCVDRICSECRDDSTCEECQECNNGECQRVAGCCRTDADCPSPGRCWVDQRPVQDGELGRCGPQCHSNADCDAGLICDGGQCVEPPECTTDEDCSALERCLDDAGVNNCRCENTNCRYYEPELCNMAPVRFDFDEDRLRADASDVIDRNIECLNGERADQSVILAGHCDERGTEEYNMALGERRARNVERYVERNGVDDDRLSTRSYGETRPANRGSNESAYSENRRVEFDAQ